ncbi:cupin domain-containing protein [Saccharospirillum salsuginis]|uniref:Cupin type-2 domain-containing protein n=1 Tax=Saccharospirillum salsuginis TaxID=418750 RepID=A0A918N7D0_9GAMM|nr:cupin domain-containing protein [Saccharospirillum salsuginis]GGX43511.1 hypothetical protein GCM10007392_07810 [Saccharospirillum salsuginis]
MSNNHTSSNVLNTFVRLRSDATVERLPVGERFWQQLSNGELGTFHNEFLVTSHHFDSDWGSWEMHPKGDEVVCVLAGRVTFVLEEDDGEHRVELCEPGDFVVVPQGVWHTAEASEPVWMLFLTAGEGTEHRAR